MEDEELAPEADESAEQDTEVAALRKAVAKANKEAARYRVEARNAKIASEFGEQVSEFVPKDLSLDEAREYALKLKEAFAAPETEAHDSPAADEEAPVAPHPLAAVSQPSTGHQTSGLFTMAQIDEIAQTDPTRAREIVASGNWDKG
jgi:hypothetical protein